MLLDAGDSQLLVIDFQERLMPAIHEGQAVLDRGICLVRAASLLDVPVLATEQAPDRLGGTVPSIASCLDEAGAQVLSKVHFSACADGLLEALRPTPAVRGNARSLPKHLQKVAPAPARGTVVVAGCETHVCVLQTALDLLEEDFDVFVVTDACGSRRERDRDAALDRLAGAGAELVTFEMVAFEWMRHAQHARFREVHALIR